MPAVDPRHPTCPYCGHNLTGICDRVMTRIVRCPECGEEVESHDVRWSRRAGDWTLAMGIRNGALFLLWRGAIVAALLLGNILFLEWLGNIFNQTSPGFRFGLATLLIVQVIFGLPAGKILSKGFEDAAGFFGILLPALATASLVIVAILLRTIVVPFQPNFTPVDLALFMACGVAAIVIIADYMREMM